METTTKSSISATYHWFGSRILRFSHNHKSRCNIIKSNLMFRAFYRFRRYATASARSDGMFLLCGGRDSSGAALGDAYGLLMHRSGEWEWTRAPGVSPSPRYQHAAVIVGARLHVTGRVLRGGRAVKGEAAIAVLDTAAGVWLDRAGFASSTQVVKGQTEHNTSLELMRRCRHAAASVGVQI